MLPGARMDNRRAVLASEKLILWVQQFRDGYAVPQLGWEGTPAPSGPVYYERFRLYARQIDDVGPLVDWLKEQGIEPVSRIEDIAPVQALNHGLSMVLLIVATFAASGFVIAVAATQWSGVQRKRRELALLSLIGYRSVFLIAVALTEALMLGAAGILMSLLFFFGAATSINTVFAQYQRLGASACRLGLTDMGMVSICTIGLTLAASAVAAWQITGIEPAKMLREE